MTHNIYVYILLMALVTYLIRSLPILFFNRPIENRFLKSFLYYLPYVALAAMTFPAILGATASAISSAAALVVATLLAYRKKGLFCVALSACLTVFVIERLLEYFSLT